jgi:hypothetical protein
MTIRDAFCGAAALLLMCSTAHADLVFADWTSLNTSANAASGTVAGTSIFLSAGGAGDIRGGTVAGDSAIFNSSAYSPALGLSDYIALAGGPGGGWGYTITFGQAVLNPVLHLYSLASVLHTSAASITELSDDGRLSVSGNTVVGSANGSTDANGTVQFNGSFTSVSFWANYIGGGTSEEFYLQIGASQIPAPPPPDSPPPDSPPPTPGAIPEPAARGPTCGHRSCLRPRCSCVRRMVRYFLPGQPTIAATGGETALSPSSSLRPTSMKSLILPTYPPGRPPDHKNLTSQTAIGTSG